MALANQHWTPTKSFPYPVRVLNKKRRTFQPSWQDRFPWLAYSKKLDSVFCLPCVLFAASGQHLGQLYYQPFNNWTKSTAEITRHESQKAHETVRFADFERTASGEKADVATQLSSEHQRQAEENMTRLCSVISTVMFLGRQNIPLRGHRHEASKDRRALSGNPGNFMALMNFRAEAGDAHATGSLYQARGGKYVTYCGSRIQNDVIQCCGDEIRDLRVKAINQSPFFAILADEASGCSNKEQMPLVVRYVADTGICEDFLGFTLCDSGTSDTALAQLILQKLGEWGLNLDRLRGQGYDGAGNMAGRLSGCSAIIRQSYPKALYVHCSSHCLNLCVVAATKITPVSSMWSILLEVSIFFKYSSKRQAKLESVITANNEGATVRKLVDLCKTR